MLHILIGNRKGNFALSKIYFGREVKMKNFVIIVVIAFALTGCISKPPVQNVPAAPQPTIDEKETVTDILVDTLANKKTGYLYRVLYGLLDGGTIVSRKVDGETINGEYELVVEKWVLTDKGGNNHLVVIKNGKLNKISPIEDDREKPIGGWH
jgi:hypothetical protein